MQAAGYLWKALGGLVLAGMLSFTANAQQITPTGPLSASSFSALNGAGATYGPPAAAHFTEPGPVTVPSGAPSPLYAGPTPGAEQATALLLVLSADPANLASLAGPITVSFNALPPIAFRATDFYTQTATGFPGNIPGLANGEVNGIKFTDTLHAGAAFDFGELIGNLYDPSEFIADLTIASTINLRVDVFGALGGLIVNNAANSEAEGVTGGALLSEPLSVVLLGTGILGFWRLRRSGAKWPRRGFRP